MSGRETAGPGAVSGRGERETGVVPSLGRPGSLVATALARAVYEAQTVVAPVPWLALPLARLRGHGVPVGRDTEVVIEGYPRSANSFTVAAFRRAQGREVRVAHHVHAPAQVVQAVRWRVPALVLVRRPEDAVLEYVLKKAHVTVAQALRGWVRFYAPLLRWRHGFVVGPFEEVTSDLGAVIRRLNERFGTSFVPFEHTEENARAALEELDRWWRDRLGPGLSLEVTVGRPSEVRDRLKEALRPRYRDPALAPLRERAEALYRRFVVESLGG
ncbi:MAG TPA: hypothetical protein VNO34_04815 [Actinomycetota bacterium]|nr:hypothetical protein [Actinomycetota bacterium]